MHVSDRTAIEWADASWNPVRARNRASGKIGWYCEHVSEACRYCYAEGFNHRLGTGLDYKPGNLDQLEIFIDEKTLLQPLHWRRRRGIFPCSMTDLFGHFVTDEMLDRIFAVMALCLQHTFRVLTKRAGRMQTYMANPEREARWMTAVADLFEIAPSLMDRPFPIMGRRDPWLPLPNVWLGVSAEDQATFDERVGILADVPAAIRFVSAEPLLGPIDIGNAFDSAGSDPAAEERLPVDWLIAGGESGPGARPMHPDWARSLRDQCARAGVAFFFKQWGEHEPTQLIADGRPEPWRRSPNGRESWAFHELGMECLPKVTFCRVGKKVAGRLLDGREHSEFPA